MYVAHYSDFLDQMLFKDEAYAFFCGVKDMIKYYFDLPHYNPSQKTSNVAKFIVTDYSNMKPIEGYQAYNVIGSVVFEHIK